MKELFEAAFETMMKLTRFIIRFAPIGVFGLMVRVIGESGLGAFKSLGLYMLTISLGLTVHLFIVLPILLFGLARIRPWIHFQNMSEAMAMAFSTSSSLATLPVTLRAVEEKVGVSNKTSSFVLPMGATINMGGAAITITVLTLAAVNTLGIPVDLPTALLLSVIAALSACGASGVPGGSLLFIPLACGLFGIQNDIAMQVVAVGFVISIVQDSAETALNSSTDVVFTAAVASKT